jgi:AcrR family transcriptional regulator
MSPRRTQAQRREETRKALLVSAREVFGRRGFGGATLDEISDIAGLSRGALYYNFPEGKEELFLALLDERIAERAGAVRATFAHSDGSPHDTIRQAGQAAADASVWLAPENREWTLLFFEFVLHASRSPRFASTFVEREQDMRDALTDVIASSAARLGGAPPIPPAHLAIGINALANGLALDTLVDEDAVPEELFSTLIRFLVRGMIAGAQEPAASKGGSKK